MHVLLLDCTSHCSACAPRRTATVIRTLGRSRSARGNIILLSCVLFALAAFLIIVALSSCGLYFLHNRLQCSANELALAGAKKLNERDRLGQMNNMIARCRQLVNSSRGELDQTLTDFKEIESFARPLLDESRDSSMRLELERKALADTVRREATEEIRQQFDSVKSSYTMSLPWLRVSNPQLVSIVFGKIEGLESNVEEFSLSSKLAVVDRSQDNIDAAAPAGKPPGSSGGLSLYRSEKDLKLPAPDNDLTFKLSSLWAPVNGFISPSRVILSKTFKDTTKNDIAPAAVQVVLRVKVETSLGNRCEAVLEARGASVTNGASSQI